MLLAIDIGNTNVKCAIFRGEELVAQLRLQTDRVRPTDEYAALLETLLRHRGIALSDIAGVSLSSTVPVLVSVFRDLAARYLPAGAPFLVVGPHADTGITVDIDNPNEIGADRIADALAAATDYPLPAIVVDFGTATTFNAITADRRLVGAAIAPGFTTAMDGLFQRAARLSRIEFARPKTAIGRNTAAALHSGWGFGYVGLVEGIVTRIKRELGGSAFVIATGGLARDVIADTEVFDAHDPLLTLKGLRLFYERNAPSPGGSGA